MKKIFYILVYIFSLNCYAQEQSFFGNFKAVDLPLVVDDLTFLNLESYPKIEFKAVKDKLKSLDGSFKIIIQDQQHQLFAIGKYEHDGLIFLILGSKNPSNNYNSCFVLVYDNNQNLQSFRDIAFQDYNKFKFKRSLLTHNNIFEYTTNGSAEYSEQHLEYSKSTDRFPYVKTDEIKINRKEMLNSPPDREMITYDFSKNFFEKNLNLLPFKYFSPYSNTQTLTSIDGNDKRGYKNYFIDSKELVQNEKILFFLNIYNFDDYLNVKEVGYILFNSTGKVLKLENIALYYEDKDGKVVINAAKVDIINNSLIILRDDPDPETMKQVFTIDSRR